MRLICFHEPQKIAHNSFHIFVTNKLNSVCKISGVHRWTVTQAAAPVASLSSTSTEFKDFIMHFM